MILSAALLSVCLNYSRRVKTEEVELFYSELLMCNGSLSDQS